MTSAGGKMADRFKLTPRPILYGVLIILACTVSYIYVYQVMPFPEPWSDIYLAVLPVVAAVLAAVAATLVWKDFAPQDAPRFVWLQFALGWWCWAIAEATWLAYYVQDIEVPAITLSDVFWLVGIGPFALAFLYQYRLILSPSHQKETSGMGLAIMAILLVSLAGTVLLHQFGPESEQTWLEVFLGVFYTAVDAAMLVAGVGLARLFGRGMWGRAWLGLLTFVLADGLYSWLSFSGLYAYSAESGSLLTLVSDTLYMDAYLLVALACLTQHLLLCYGPSLMPSSVVEASSLA